MHTRQNALNKWLATIVEHTNFTLTPLTGDASFRRYFRLHTNELSRVVMDAPPSKETIGTFVTLGEALSKIGIHTPAVHAVDPTNGFALLEDLGDALFLKVVSQDNANILYTTAITTLVQIQQCSTTNPMLPIFDKPFMLQELALFHEWFLHAHLELKLNSDEEHLLDNTFNWLTTQIMNQPQVFIHRDYHSRNLLVVSQNTPPDLGVIDFQDAMCGPFTYDLVSLLKDCYIEWPSEQITRWLIHFYHELPSGMGWSLLDFNRAFDLCGLQRHLKVLGTFCRLSLRDNKFTYLRDLPLTFSYVMGCIRRYDELKPLHNFMQQRVHLAFIKRYNA